MHALTLEAPTAAECVLTGQRSQKLAPLPAAKLPGGQGRHGDSLAAVALRAAYMPVSAKYEPETQARHESMLD